MQVIKRSGKTEEAKSQKIEERVKNLSLDLKKIEPFKIAQKVINGVFDGITTTQIDELLAETSAMFNDEHYEYGLLAGRALISALHKKTSDNFYHTMKDFYNQDLLSVSFISKVKKYAKPIQKIIDYERDLNFDIFAVRTLMGRPTNPSYLMRINGEVKERPQHLFMRVAVEIADDNFEAIKELYDLLSQGYYTHATPTLFNAGLKNNSCSSCYLIAMEDDSIEGIFNTVKESALISKYSGGIGIHVSNIRASGSKILGNNGTSSGLIPWLKIFNETARSVNQAGKRKGSIAIYLEPWHADVEAFLDLPKEQGPEEIRARDLFLSLWMPDLFFERAKNNENWSLFCPNECKGLQDVYGEDFKILYEQYEQEGKAKKFLKARDLMGKIAESQIQHGIPYLQSKDNANRKSNQKNIGVIKSSNLCSEIYEVSDNEHTAVCNLASICLPKFVSQNSFDFEHLEKVVRIATRNLNNVIDRTHYPTPKGKKSNLRDRPIGIGAQGLGDVFYSLGLPFGTESALKLDQDIFETIYYAFLKESCELAKQNGAYETFSGSPASQGILQFDFWNVQPSTRHDWSALKQDIKSFGLRNSLGIALMPTASTASIFANTEAFEPLKGNIFKREILSGEFMIVNKHLIDELEKISLWNATIKNRIIADRGSVQNIEEIPLHLRELFKTAYELKQKVIIDHAVVRSPFVDQGQSMNLYFENPNISKLTSATMYAWEQGLKTLNYYIRSKIKAVAPRVGEVAEQIKKTADEQLICSLDNREACEMCSS